MIEICEQFGYRPECEVVSGYLVGRFRCSGMHSAQGRLLAVDTSNHEQASMSIVCMKRNY